MSRNKKGTTPPPPDFEEVREAWKEDFPGFAEACLRVVDRDNPTGASVSPFIFNACQNAIWDLVLRIMAFNIKRSTWMNRHDPSVPISPYPVKIVVLKARKVGISTWIEAYIMWRGEFEAALTAMVMAHHLKTAKVLGKILKNFVNWWPKELTPYRVPVVRSPDEMMAWEAEHGSKIEIETAGTRVQGANRGRTFHVLHISEEAFITDPSEVSAALEAQVGYSVVFEESTANGPGDLFHENWIKSRKIEDAEASFAAGEADPEDWNGSFQFFWPWYADPGRQLPIFPGEEKQILATITEEEQDLQRLYGITLQQLKWRRSIIHGAGSKQIELSAIDYFHQEYPTTPEEAFVVKGNTPFDQARLVKQLEAAKTYRPLCFRMTRIGEDQWEWQGASAYNANFKVYEQPVDGHQYIIGTDSSEGGGSGDPSVIVIFDRTDGTHLEEVARFRGNVIPDELGELAVLLAMHYNEAFIIPERNVQGKATCLKIARLGYAWVYHSKNIEVHSDNEEPNAFMAGFYMAPSIRPTLVNQAAFAFQDGRVLLRDIVAINEWMSFQYIDGKPQAPLGKHDDCVMADLLCVFGQFTPMAGAPHIENYFNEEGEIIGEEVVKQLTSGERLGQSIREMKAKWDRLNERRRKLEERTRRGQYGRNPLS